jgi:hypothetical protein
VFRTQRRSASCFEEIEIEPRVGLQKQTATRRERSERRRGRRGCDHPHRAALQPPLKEDRLRRGKADVEDTTIQPVLDVGGVRDRSSRNPFDDDDGVARRIGDDVVDVGATEPILRL